MTVPVLLAAELRRDGARPFLTWYDDDSGARVELSVATTANWVTKTANFMADELDIQTGDVLRVDRPEHWLGIIVALAAWTVGATVALGANAELALPGDIDGFTRSVLPHPDVLVIAPAEADVIAVVTAQQQWTATELATAAAGAAEHHGIARGARVLSTLPIDTIDGIDAGLLIPLAVGGSIVLVAKPGNSLATRAQSERVTHTAGVSVPGLPQLV